MAGSLVTLATAALACAGGATASKFPLAHRHFFANLTSSSTAEAATSSTLPTSFHWTNSSSPAPTTSPDEMTTSVVYTTRVHSVTKCPPWVENCPEGDGGDVSTETVPLYTTVCPVSAAPTSEMPPTTTSEAPMTTSVVYTTHVHSKTKCPPGADGCPDGGDDDEVSTETVPLYTTVCPVEETESSPAPPEATPPPQGGRQTITSVVSNMHTITECPPEVTDCPVGSVSTEEITTTYCPEDQESTTYTTWTSTVTRSITISSVAPSTTKTTPVETPSTQPASTEPVSTEPAPTETATPEPTPAKPTTTESTPVDMTPSPDTSTVRTPTFSPRPSVSSIATMSPRPGTTTPAGGCTGADCAAATSPAGGCTGAECSSTTSPAGGCTGPDCPASGAGKLGSFSALALFTAVLVALL